MMNISARKLHESLQSKSHFSEWFGNRLNTLQLQENIDYRTYDDGKLVDYLLSHSAAALVMFSMPNGSCLDMKKDWIDGSLACRDVVQKIADQLPTTASFNTFFRYDGELVVTSQRLAEFTGKSHKNVLRDIERVRATLSELLTSSDVILLEAEAHKKHLEGFREGAYLDAKGEKRKLYTMTEASAMILMAQYSVRFRSLLIADLHKQRAYIDAYCKKHVAYTTLIDTAPQIRSAQVYLLRGTVTGQLKIGISSSMSGRIAAINGSSDPVVVEYLSPPCTNFMRIGRAAHAYFADYRTHGEWFSGVSASEVVRYLEVQAYDLELTLPEPPIHQEP